MPTMTTRPSHANESERRRAQNHAHAALALEHLDPADPRLAWLFPARKGQPLATMRNPAFLHRR